MIYIARKIINDVKTNDVIKKINDYLKKPNNNMIRIRSRKLVETLTFNSKNFGKFVLVNYRPGRHTEFICKFIDTGYVTTALMSQIRTGNVKDYTRPFISNIGFLGGNFKHLCKDNDLHKVLYIKWTNMINRCYNINYANYRTYGKLGISVDSRWHNYSNFYEDAQKLEGFNLKEIISGKLTLDKDKYQQSKPKSEMKYSKDTCCWISVREQNMLVNHDIAQDSLKQYFVATFPNGNKIIGKGISGFAREYKLDSGDCSRALNGKINHVKNIRFRKATNKEIEILNESKVQRLSLRT